jgi:hypothetical protein
MRKRTKSAHAENAAPWTSIPLTTRSHSSAQKTVVLRITPPNSKPTDAHCVAAVPRPISRAMNAHLAPWVSQRHIFAVFQFGKPRKTQVGNAPVNFLP